MFACSLVAHKKREPVAKTPYYGGASARASEINRKIAPQLATCVDVGLGVRAPGTNVRHAKQTVQNITITLLNRMRMHCAGCRRVRAPLVRMATHAYLI